MIRLSGRWRQWAALILSVPPLVYLAVTALALVSEFAVGRRWNSSDSSFAIVLMASFVLTPWTGGTLVVWLLSSWVRNSPPARGVVVATLINLLAFVLMWLTTSG